MVRTVAGDFGRFLRAETAGGLVLLAAAALLVRRGRAHAEG
jgi:hypothetical protein